MGATCTIVRAGAVPGAPGARRGPQGAGNLPKTRSRIHHLILPITKPYKFIRFGARAITPYEFIGFGAIAITKPYEFIGFGATLRSASARTLAEVRKRAEHLRGRGCSQGPIRSLRFTYLRLESVITELLCCFLASFRPNLAPRPLKSGRARKMVHKSPKISPGDHF